MTKRRGSRRKEAAEHARARTETDCAHTTLLPWLGGGAHSKLDEATQVSRTAHTLSLSLSVTPADKRKFQEATKRQERWSEYCGDKGVLGDAKGMSRHAASRGSGFKFNIFLISCALLLAEKKKVEGGRRSTTCEAAATASIQQERNTAYNMQSASI